MTHVLLMPANVPIRVLRPSADRPAAAPLQAGAGVTPTVRQADPERRIDRGLRGVPTRTDLDAIARQAERQMRRALKRRAAEGHASGC